MLVSDGQFSNAQCATDNSFGIFAYVMLEHYANEWYSSAVNSGMSSDVSVYAYGITS